MLSSPGFHHGAEPAEAETPILSRATAKIAGKLNFQQFTVI
jgi:hypothetical protein